jgi:5-methylcytosine-specific restriction protein B
MYAFQNWMKINDLVFISSGNLKIIAIGQVKGDYEYKDDVSEIDYCQFRKVQWLFIDELGIPVDKLLTKKLSQQTIYNLDKSYIKKDFFYSLFTDKDVQEKPYILIIDEINRGNISKIFGELITLIEPSKRLDTRKTNESLEVTLPYSNQKFGVPKNVYIIGTMNTADRSIALMDTALRRRFDFEEMMPKYDIDNINTNIEDSGVNLQEILKKINSRVKYLYDRDHTIGHAYFIGINTFKELDNVMRNKIIPLLQEYFYDDWEKIQIVLGDHDKQLDKVDADKRNNYKFIQSEKLQEKHVLGFSHDDIEETQVDYTINDKFTLEMYKKICK